MADVHSTLRVLMMLFVVLANDVNSFVITHKQVVLVVYPATTARIHATSFVCRGTIPNLDLFTKPDILYEFNNEFDRRVESHRNCSKDLETTNHDVKRNGVEKTVMRPPLAKQGCQASRNQ